MSVCLSVCYLYFADVFNYFNIYLLKVLSRSYSLPENTPKVKNETFTNFVNTDKKKITHIVVNCNINYTHRSAQNLKRTSTLPPQNYHKPVVEIAYLFTFYSHT